MPADNLKISLVIPVYNESKSIAALVRTIKGQTRLPDEVIFVDGGSTDNTVAIIGKLTADAPYFTVQEAGRAMPGKGRNIGAARALYSWLAFTDAGITLDKDWLKNLVLARDGHPEASIIYGNYAPVINRFFDVCSAITYVSPAQADHIRGKSIVSCLLKKEVWEKAGGFPDWRAAEDLVFMERAENAGYSFAEAPDALASWELRPNFAATFRKFDLYSKYNVWAGRQRYWHYGVARQYAVLLPFLLAGFLHHPAWFLMLPLWICARTAKRMLIHRKGFSTKVLLNPAVFICVLSLTLLIDLATFTGWIKAVFTKPVAPSLT